MLPRSTIISQWALFLCRPYESAILGDGERLRPRGRRRLPRHIASALARLADGGRLVTITGANFGPEQPAWRDAFMRLQERGRVVFTATIDGSLYARHGTTIETRLTVIDKLPAEEPATFPASTGIAPDVATLLAWIEAQVPPRLPAAMPESAPPLLGSAPRAVRGYIPTRRTARPAAPPSIDPEGVELAYNTVGLDAARGRAPYGCDL